MIDAAIEFANDNSGLALVWSVLCFSIGFLTDRFLLSKSQRLDISYRNYKNYSEFKGAERTYRRAFTASLQNVLTTLTVDELDLANLNDFADDYFSHINVGASAVLDGHVEKTAKDEMVGVIVDCFNQNILKYYGVIQKKSRQLNLSCPHKFKKSSYPAIVKVVELYSPNTCVPDL